MTAKHLIQLRCDHVQCYTVHTVRDVGSKSLARHIADALGWRHKGDRDYCPEHSPIPETILGEGL